MDNVDYWMRLQTLVVDRFGDLVPAVLSAVVVVVVSIVVVRVVRKIALRFFVVFRLDLLANRLGLTDFLDQSDMRHLVAEMLATVVYWIVTLLGIEGGCVLLGLEGLANVARTILSYGPRIAVAAVVVVAATTAARLLGIATERVASSARFPAARGLARIVRILVVFFGLVMGLEELQIATSLLIGSVQILLAGVTFGVALAFGLGCKDMARDAAARWFKPVITSKKTEEPGA